MTTTLWVRFDVDTDNVKEAEETIKTGLATGIWHLMTKMKVFEFPKPYVEELKAKKQP